MKKFATLVLSALLLCSLTSCGETVVMRYGDSTITENEFTYYLATYKNVYLKTYTDVSDTAEFYHSTMADGRTGEEYLFDLTVENVKMSLVSEELFRTNRLTLSSAVEESVDRYVTSFVEDYAGGDKKSLNLKLSEYGINVNMLREIYLTEEKGTALYDYLYGSNGTIGVTDEERAAYYDGNYIRLRHIYVNNRFYYVTDESGYATYDDDGNMVTAPYTGEELAAKNENIRQIEEALAAGESFDTVYAQYSEDQYYKNGYYLTHGTDFVKEVAQSAFSLEIGEYTKVESDVGTHYIMRLPLEERAWEDEENKDFFGDFENEVRYDAFVQYVKQYTPAVEVDEEALAAFSVENSAINYRF